MVFISFAQQVYQGASSDDYNPGSKPGNIYPFYMQGVYAQNKLLSVYVLEEMSLYLMQAADYYEIFV